MLKSNGKIRKDYRRTIQHSCWGRGLHSLNWVHLMKHYFSGLVYPLVNMHWHSTKVCLHVVPCKKLFIIFSDFTILLPPGFAALWLACFRLSVFVGKIKPCARCIIMEPKRLLQTSFLSPNVNNGF